MEHKHSGYWGTFTLMILGLIGALWLQKGLAIAPVALMFIFLAIIVGAIVLIAQRMKYEWAWSMTLVYFALLLLNSGLVFANVTNHVIAFAIASMAPLCGLMLSMMHLSEPIDAAMPIETAATQKSKKKAKKR